MDKRTAICEFLRKHHTGKDKAIYSRELERLFSLDGRTLRRKISSLRQDGFPICSDETGYYYAETRLPPKLPCSSHFQRPYRDALRLCDERRPGDGQYQHQS